MILKGCLDPVRALYEDVRRKALMRLEYEGLHKAEAITTVGARFHNDPAGKVVNCVRPFQFLSVFRITLTDRFWPDFLKKKENSAVFVGFHQFLRKNPLKKVPGIVNLA